MLQAFIVAIGALGGTAGTSADTVRAPSVHQWCSRSCPCWLTLELYNMTVSSISRNERNLAITTSCLRTLVLNFHL